VHLGQWLGTDINYVLKHSNEKRKHPRVEAKVRVSFRTMEELVQEYTRNISGGGIFMKTNQLLDPNAEIELSVKFPDGLGEFTVKGKVKRLMSLTHPEDSDKQLYGVGVQFIDPDPKMVQIIEKAVASNRVLKKD